MIWDEYVKEFSEQALLRGFDDSYVARCLEYAGKLHQNGLAIIYSRDHLSELLDLNLNFFATVEYSPESVYRTFFIKKRLGGERQIDEPLPDLKKAQYWIYHNILAKISVSDSAYGFIAGRSIKEAAIVHINPSKVLKVDIKDFFGSITASKVEDMFCSVGYCKKVASTLSMLCTYNGTLPQGSPASPCISNLVFRHIDKKVSDFCKSRDIKYTRYADDLTFSGEFKSGNVIGFVCDALREVGLQINPNKTREMKKNKRQTVLGLTVNDRVDVARSLRRKIRQELYYIKKYGVDAHIATLNNSRVNYISHLLGIVEHILYVNPISRDALELKSIIKELKSIRK